MEIISDELLSKFTSIQKDGESMQDYIRQFKTSTEILEYHLGGMLMIYNYVKNMYGYNKNKPSKTGTMVKQSSEIMFTYIYLENSDHEKYVSIMQSLSSNNTASDQGTPIELSIDKVWNGNHIG